MILNPENYDLYDVVAVSTPAHLTAAGQIAVEGPLTVTVTAALSGEPIGATFIPSDAGNGNLPTWHILVAKPIGTASGLPGGAPVGVEILRAEPPDE